MRTATLLIAISLAGCLVPLPPRNAIHRIAIEDAGEQSDAGQPEDAGTDASWTCTPEPEATTCSRLHLCGEADAVDNCGVGVRLSCACAADSGSTCGDGLSVCAGACVDLLTDPDNCGRCGTGCEAPLPDGGSIGWCRSGTCFQ